MKKNVLTIGITLSTLIMVLLNMPSQAQCHIDDWTALKALYESTDGDNWVNKTGWEVTNGMVPPVDCNLEYLYRVGLDESGRVDYLSLSRNQLTGSIPPELGNLSNLTELRLNYNELSGSIPPELGNLSKLTNLSLGDNELSGSIPLELGNLSNLTNLRLYTNQLSGSIPPELGNLSNLTDLSLSSNQLSGSIPSELGNLNNLTDLSLSGNQLSGSIPPELGNLSNLTHLWLDNNQLSGSIPPELGNLSNLTYLYLQGNQLSGSIPPELGNLSNLTILILGFNQLSGGIPPELGNLSNLATLGLHNNNLSGCYSDSLINWCDKFYNSNISDGNNFEVPFEYFCTIGNCECDPSMPLPDPGCDDGECSNGVESWDGCNCMAGVAVEIPDCNDGECSNGVESWDGCNCVAGTAPIDPGCDDGDCNNGVETWDGCNCVDGVPVEIPNCDDGNCVNGVETYNAATCSCETGTPLVNPGCDDGDCTNGLETWDGCECMAGEAPADPNCYDPCHLDDWTALKALYESTDGNNWRNKTNWSIVTGEAPPPNCNLEELYGITLNDQGRVYELSLTSNQLNGSIPTELGNLSNLTMLYIGSNQLSGSIPPELSNLTNLNRLYLWKNDLSGNIPPELGNLSNLTGLDLERNQLSGSIPPELGNLSKLTHLDLNENQLRDNIPLELGNLTNLTLLYLYNNELSGSLPPELGNLTKLTDLWLQSNELSGSLPPELGNLTNLTDLWLQSNELSGSLPPELGYLSNLTSLKIYGNDLSGCYPTSITQFCTQLTNFHFFTFNYFYSYYEMMYTNEDISEGNSFDASWVDFCNYSSGTCPPDEIPNCHRDDWTALKALYQSTNGDAWINNTGWEQVTGEAPPENCNLQELHGISLNDQARVFSFKLQSNQLSGSLPPELGNLTNLTDLWLQSNELSGSLPPELGNLTNLISLRLYNNQLSGSIPSELGNLGNLTLFDIGKNVLSGNIPPELGNLINLTSLRLTNNQFSGSIPRTLGSLTNLTGLSLASNELIDSIPAELGNLTNLRYLDLSGNQLSGSIPSELGNLTNWYYLNLGYNQLSGCYAESLSVWCDIHDYEIHIAYVSEGNNFDVPFKDFFCWTGNCVSPCHREDWTALKSLYQSTDGDNWSNNAGWPTQIANQSSPPDNCNLGDLYGVTLGADERVTSIELTANNLNGSLPPEIGDLVNLTQLSLHHNQLSDTIPSSLGNLTKLPNLDLSYNRFSGNIPAALQNLSNISSLNLSNNQLNGNLPPELGNLSKLNSINLSNNQLSGKIPEELANLNYLYDLDLSKNLFDGALPVELANLSQLKNLYLDHNQFSGEIPPDFANLTNLTALNLGSNQLCGKIPAELGNLDSLTYLGLYNNILTDAIPTALSNLTNLQYLGLFANQLSGQIPEALVDMNSLIELDLRRNELSGDIPAELAQLNNLESLLIDYNYFSCTDLQSSFTQLSQLDEFEYLPQNLTPPNYDEIKSQIISTPNTDAVSVTINFPGGASYQWHRNEVIVPDAIDSTLNLAAVNPENVGKYTVHIQSEQCLQNATYQAVSEPIYVVLKGYDLLGKPLEYKQLMVLYKNKADRERYEEELFLDNGGILKDHCNCNRELYLYDFSSDSSKIELAYIALDEKIKDFKSTNEIDGGFNYQLNSPDLINDDGIPSDVTIFFEDADYQSDIRAYILDSGFDESGFEESANYLLAEAPMDSCYNIRSSGYNYALPLNKINENTITFNTNYEDHLGHGTYGFRTISKGIEDLDIGKIVPIKIIEEATNGNLFDLICGLYHAVDHNADIINISAGYRGESSDILEKAINLARKKEIFIVAAAGNDSIDINNIDEIPQYPAHYASLYHYFYNENEMGIPILDSVRYNNMISVAAVNSEGQLWKGSNYGKQSVTIAAPGKSIFGFNLGSVETAISGTSIATFLTTQVLAREIAKDNSRSVDSIWTDFENGYLVDNANLAGITRTGKHINFQWETDIEINGCIDSKACNFNPYATLDDGTCYTCTPLDCMDCSANCSPCPLFVLCPDPETSYICSPVDISPPMLINDFTSTGSYNLSELGFQVDEEKITNEYYNTTTYTYTFIDSTSNQQTCKQNYHISTQFLQAPEAIDTTFICQDELFSYIKIGTKQYKIYEDNNGTKGDVLAICNTPGLHCNTAGLNLNTSINDTHQFWVTQFFNFPDGVVCESEPTPFWVEIYPKPIVELSTSFHSVSPGQSFALNDLVTFTEDTNGNWTGENIVYLLSIDAGNIPIFSTNNPGVYKLYYTVKNEHCPVSYLLIVEVSTTARLKDKENKEIEKIFRYEDVQSFNMYPNPANDYVHIILPVGYNNTTTIQILDLSGKIILENIIEDKYDSIDVSDLAKGMYIVHIQNDKNSSTQKLLVD